MGDKTIINIGQKNGSTAKIILEGDSRSSLYGLLVGSEFAGDLIADDYSDYTFKITGGSDDDGVPMRQDIVGTSRVRPLIGDGVGHRQTRDGVRKRKLVRGTEMFDDIAQLNVKVIKKGKKKFTEN